MPEEYYVYPVVEGADYREHTEERPFCADGDCPCHEDDENQETLTGWYNEGLIGTVDGDLIYHGGTI